MRLSVVVVCMPDRGHLQRLVPVIAALAGRGAAVHVLTADAFAAEVMSAGGRFVDLFAGLPLDAADSESLPFASRYVSFAGAYLDAVTERIGALRPGLIVYDTFALVAPLAARRLGVPHVNVCAGHAAVPERVLAALRTNPRVATSAACWRAVEQLRARGALPGAHPHSYVEAQSPFLNLYCEPPQFLDEADRAAFAPIAFFGSLSPGRPTPPRPAHPAVRAYVCFGTVVWRALRAPAHAALTALATALTRLGVETHISVGRAEGGFAAAGVRVDAFADQWAALAGADVFVTHHGLSSTHEAIFHQVPMLSYPFFGDQPALARRCQDFGLALPLADELRGPIEPDAVAAALARLRTDRDRFAARLADARAWELETIAARPAVIDRMLALVTS